MTANPRRLFEWTCTRCGLRQRTDFEHQGIVEVTPDGWTVAFAFRAVLCTRCSAEVQEFIGSRADPRAVMARTTNPLSGFTDAALAREVEPTLRPDHGRRPRMNLLLMKAHSIASYDDVRLFHHLGYGVFNLDAYIDPSHPHVDMRPALPDVPTHRDLIAAVDALGTADNLTAAKERLPDALIDWCDAVIVDHYLERWMVPNFRRLRAAGKRVIWRTCGQSDLRLEDALTPFRAGGLEVVRYSPAEQRFFEPAGAWAGQDALIRFAKFSDDHPAWTGPVAGIPPFIANVTQDMVGRGEHCGLSWYVRSTAGMLAHPSGPGSEALPGGVGTLLYRTMLRHLSVAAAYAYAGTVPASYTLGLMEALLVGVPVVSIGPGAWMGPDWLFEGHELAPLAFDDPADAREALRTLVNEPGYAKAVSDRQRAKARSLFDVSVVGPQWVDFLGQP